MRSFDVTYHASLNKWLNKQSRSGWIEISWRSLHWCIILILATYFIMIKIWIVPEKQPPRRIGIIKQETSPAKTKITAKSRVIRITILCHDVIMILPVITLFAAYLVGRHNKCRPSISPSGPEPSPIQLFQVLRREAVPLCKSNSQLKWRLSRRPWRSVQTPATSGVKHVWAP